MYNTGELIMYPCKCRTPPTKESFYEPIPWSDLLISFSVGSLPSDEGAVAEGMSERAYETLN